MTPANRKVPDRGDVIHKQSKAKGSASQYVLVLSPADYNRRTGAIIGLWVSTNDDHRSNPFATLVGNTTGPAIKDLYALSNSPGSFTWDLESTNIVCEAPESAVNTLCESLNQIIQIAN